MSGVASSWEACRKNLEEQGKPLTGPNDSSIWCNATWDAILCWPSTPANSSVTQPCPSLKGLDPTKSLRKLCHESGLWMGKTESDFRPDRPWGHTDYGICMTTEMKSIMNNMGNDILSQAQDIAKSARLLEFILLGISFFALLVGIVLFVVFSYRRRRFCFFLQPYLHLMLASLAVVVIRLTLYIDLKILGEMGGGQVVPSGSIHVTKNICEVFYFLLEYFKASLITWFAMDCLYLLVKSFWDNFRHHTVLIVGMVVLGYVLPLLNLAYWLVINVIKDKIQRCFGSYYLEKEFNTVVIPQYIALVLSLVMIVLATVIHCVKRGNLRKEKNFWILRLFVALILFVVFLIATILAGIPFTPTKDNIMWFKVYTYVVTVLYMFQGAVVAVFSVLVMVVFIKIPATTNAADREAMQKLM